jgi:hypothetical protein
MVPLKLFSLWNTGVKRVSAFSGKGRNSSPSSALGKFNLGLGLRGEPRKTILILRAVALATTLMQLPFAHATRWIIFEFE